MCMVSNVLASHVPLIVPSHLCLQPALCTSSILRVGFALQSEGQSEWQVAGLRECALGGGSVNHPRVPAWLEKWTALILTFVEEEQRLLPDQLLALPPPLNLYTPFTAAAEAKGKQAANPLAFTLLWRCYSAPT